MSIIPGSSFVANVSVTRHQVEHPGNSIVEKHCVNVSRHPLDT
jgi:hypothetical protein